MQVNMLSSAQEAFASLSFFQSIFHLARPVVILSLDELGLVFLDVMLQAFLLHCQENVQDLGAVANLHSCSKR